MIFLLNFSFFFSLFLFSSSRRRKIHNRSRVYTTTLIGGQTMGDSKEVKGGQVEGLQVQLDSGTGSRMERGRRNAFSFIQIFLSL